MVPAKICRIPFACPSTRGYPPRTLSRRTGSDRMKCRSVSSRTNPLSRPIPRLTCKSRRLRPHRRRRLGKGRWGNGKDEICRYCVVSIDDSDGDDDAGDLMISGPSGGSSRDKATMGDTTNMNTTSHLSKDTVLPPYYYIVISSHRIWDVLAVFWLQLDQLAEKRLRDAKPVEIRKQLNELGEKLSHDVPVHIRQYSAYEHLKGTVRDRVGLFALQGMYILHSHPRLYPHPRPRQRCGIIYASANPHETDVYLSVYLR